MKNINWKAFFLAVGGAFVAGAVPAFDAGLKGMTVLELPRLKAAGLAAIAAGGSLAGSAALAFFVPTYKKK